MLYEVITRWRKASGTNPPGRCCVESIDFLRVEIPRPVAFMIDDAEKTEGFRERIEQLVRIVGRDIQGIEKTDFRQIAVKQRLTTTTNHDSYNFV